jgi:hypothetical protein
LPALLYRRRFRAILQIELAQSYLREDCGLWNSFLHPQLVVEAGGGEKRAAGEPPRRKADRYWELRWLLLA